MKLDVYDLNLAIVLNKNVKTVRVFKYTVSRDLLITRESPYAQRSNFEDFSKLYALACIFLETDNNENRTIVHVTYLGHLFHV